MTDHDDAQQMLDTAVNLLTAQVENLDAIRARGCTTYTLSAWQEFRSGALGVLTTARSIVADRAARPDLTVTGDYADLTAVVDVMLKAQAEAIRAGAIVDAIVSAEWNS